MKGTIFDFVRLATEKPELAKEFVELAARYGFEFSDEVSDDELATVSGGASVKTIMQSLTGGGLPDGMSDPTGSTPSAASVPTPYPNTGTDQSGGGVVSTDGASTLTGRLKSSTGDVAG